MAGELVTPAKAPIATARGARPMILQEALQDEGEQRRLLMQYVSGHMVEGTDYGVIPGTRGAKSLLKPGAEKLTDLFRCIPEYEIVERIEDFDKPMFHYLFRCRIISRDTGAIVAEGFGSCNSRESKYRWRNADRTCPHCGQASIIKGKADYGGGWLCFARKGGCGAKFSDQDPAIASQQVGRVENPDAADAANTILKMAKKRAQVDAAIALARCSEMFTQDVEPDDYPAQYDEPRQQQRQQPQAPPAAPKPQAPAAAPAAQKPAEAKPVHTTKPTTKSPAEIAAGMQKVLPRTSLELFHYLEHADKQLIAAGAKLDPTVLEHTSRSYGLAAEEVHHLKADLVSEAWQIAIAYVTKFASGTEGEQGSHPHQNTSAGSADSTGPSAATASQSTTIATDGGVSGAGPTSAAATAATTSTDAPEIRRINSIEVQELLAAIHAADMTWPDVRDRYASVIGFENDQYATANALNTKQFEALKTILFPLAKKKRAKKVQA
jgi:hypothetical protein